MLGHPNNICAQTTVLQYYSTAQKAQPKYKDEKDSRLDILSNKLQGIVFSKLSLILFPIDDAIDSINAQVAWSTQHLQI